MRNKLIKLAASMGMFEQLAEKLLHKNTIGAGRGALLGAGIGATAGGLGGRHVARKMSIEMLGEGPAMSAEAKKAFVKAMAKRAPLRSTASPEVLEEFKQRGMFNNARDAINTVAGGVGGVLGGGTGAIGGALLGGTAGAINSAAHRARVRRLASKLRIGTGVGAAGAGIAGLAAYHKKKTAGAISSTLGGALTGGAIGGGANGILNSLRAVGQHAATKAKGGESVLKGSFSLENAKRNFSSNPAILGALLGGATGFAKHKEQQATKAWAKKVGIGAGVLGVGGIALANKD